MLRVKSYYNIGDGNLPALGRVFNRRLFIMKVKVYVLSKRGKPLMPCEPVIARLLLKQKKAKVVQRTPFTIQLNYDTTEYTQDLTLGVDTGHDNVGLSVVSETKEVYSAVATMRNDISEKMTSRRNYRRTRRNRLRYRKPRFDNRRASIRKGRLAPSVQWKVDAHVRLIEHVKKILPITKIVLETGTFDPHKLKNPNITNEQYQKGPQYGFENVKAYILHRDGYKCQSGKSGCSKTLHVHHIKFRSNGGSNAPENLITLCSKHHKELHDGKFTLDVPKHKSLKSATTMNVIRKRLLELYPDAIETFGYITKVNRDLYGIEKSHSNDAFVIAGGTTQDRCLERKIVFKRKNNRSLQKNRKGFKRSIRKQRYNIQPKDIVLFNGKRYYAQGIQSRGVQLKMTDGIKSISKLVKHVTVLFHQKGLVYV